MTQIIPIGRGTETVNLEIADGVRLEQIPAGEFASTLDDPGSPPAVATRVAQALAQPEQFLPLAEMVVPGDSVAIALDDGLPQPESIVAGILQTLEHCELGKVNVVVPASTSDEVLTRLKASLPASIGLTVHNVADRAALGYLGADEDAEAIRINRALLDADLVLPVSVMRVTDPLLGGPSGDALYPGMVDDAQRKRLQRLTARAIARRENYYNGRAASQAHQVRWTLGVQLMMAVEVTSGGGIGQIIVSSPETLREAVQAYYAAHRRDDSQQSAEVVVACIEGDDSQQTMENLMRATLAARSHAAPSGTVVLVSALKRLGVLRSVDDRAEDIDVVSGEDQETEAESAETLSQAEFATNVLHDLVNEIDGSRRYLLLFAGDWEAAEAFGFGVIQNAAALVRLIDQSASCCVLRAAQTAADAGALTSSEA